MAPTWVHLHFSAKRNGREGLWGLFVRKLNDATSAQRRRQPINFGPPVVFRRQRYPSPASTSKRDSPTSSHRAMTGGNTISASSVLPVAISVSDSSSCALSAANGLRSRLIPASRSAARRHACSRALSESLADKSRIPEFSSSSAVIVAIPLP